MPAALSANHPEYRRVQLTGHGEWIAPFSMSLLLGFFEHIFQCLCFSIKGMNMVCALCLCFLCDWHSESQELSLSPNRNHLTGICLLFLQLLFQICDLCDDMLLPCIWP